MACRQEGTAPQGDVRLEGECRQARSITGSVVLNATRKGVHLQRGRTPFLLVLRTQPIPPRFGVSMGIKRQRIDGPFPAIYYPSIVSCVG